jgi:hypothetical protein
MGPRALKSTSCNRKTGSHFPKSIPQDSAPSRPEGNPHSSFGVDHLLSALHSVLTILGHNTTQSPEQFSQLWLGFSGLSNIGPHRHLPLATYLTEEVLRD